MSTYVNPVVDVPKQLLLELAVGLEPFDDICARYEYTPAMAQALKEHPGVMARVQRLAAELRSEGVTFRVRAAFAAEDLIGDIWTEAKSKDTSLPNKLAAAQFLARMGDLEPKPANAVGTGRFSITITTNGSAAQSNIIDVAPVRDQELEQERVELRIPVRPRKSAINGDLALPSGLMAG